MFSLFGSNLTQKEKTLKLLKTGRELSPVDFIKVGVYRYWAYLYDLRKEWYVIETREQLVRDKKNQKFVQKFTFYKLK